MGAGGGGGGGGTSSGGKYVKRRTPHEWNGSAVSHSSHSNRHSDSAEVQRRLEEIMKQTGKLRIGGKEHITAPSELEDLGELGFGSCGHVFKMRFRPTGDEVAVKRLRRTGNKEENKRVIMDLDVVLRSFDCPYIVQCLGCFITDSEVWICMELMNTCLEKLYKRHIRGPIPEEILGKMAVSIIKALDYLKERQGIIHRDVKPSNMLVDGKSGTIKLCDFGISGRLVDSKAKTRTAGCAAYMAPERIEPPDPNKPDYDIRADVWSLGISLVELARGRFPYQGCSTDFEVLARILQEDPPILTPSEGFSQDFCSLVKACLTKDAKDRPKYRDLLQHAFVKDYEKRAVDVGAWFSRVYESGEDATDSAPPTAPAEITRL